MIVGYVRVSTDGQTLDVQLAALRDAGCEKVYAEKISGAITDRPGLKRLLASLQPDDQVVVTKSRPQLPNDRSKCCDGAVFSLGARNRHIARLRLRSS